MHVLGVDPNELTTNQEFPCKCYRFTISAVPGQCSNSLLFGMCSIECSRVASGVISTLVVHRCVVMQGSLDWLTMFALNSEQVRNRITFVTAPCACWDSIRSDWQPIKRCTTTSIVLGLMLLRLSLRNRVNPGGVRLNVALAHGRVLALAVDWRPTVVWAVNSESIVKRPAVMLMGGPELPSSFVLRMLLNVTCVIVSCTCTDSILELVCSFCA